MAGTSPRYYHRVSMSHQLGLGLPDGPKGKRGELIPAVHTQTNDESIFIAVFVLLARFMFITPCGIFWDFFDESSLVSRDHLKRSNKRDKEGGPSGWM